MDTLDAFDKGGAVLEGLRDVFVRHTVHDSTEGLPPHLGGKWRLRVALISCAKVEISRVNQIQLPQAGAGHKQSPQNTNYEK